jgi:1-deoxy-D-xylulose-5-phosphate synthase
LSKFTLPDTPVLDSLENREALAELDAEKLGTLCEECRAVITAAVSECGGHLASNLGGVELTVALHRAFDFAKDMLVFDVGHQCYTHKLLTGRKAGFARLRKKGGLLGFPNPGEHPSDPLVVGHASTAISSAMGLAAANRLAARDDKVVAVVGDGAATGGLCFEGLNQARHANANVLVVLNDNEISIDRTVGGLSGYLSRLRADPLYQEAKNELSNLVESIPLVGKTAGGLGRLALNVARRNLVPGQLFQELGWQYYGPVDGHDIAELEKEFRAVSRISGPVLLHVITKKGRGYQPAQEEPGAYHSAPPFYIENGKPRKSKAVSWSKAMGRAATDLAETRNDLVAVTAAMGAGTGLDEFAARFPNRYFDVGIAEAHATVFAGALSRGGMTPLVAIYSTFLQRAYDQIFHDLCIQPELGAILCLDRAGLVGADGATHQGLYDIAYLRPLPRTVLMAPRDGARLREMLELAAQSKSICALRYPREAVPADMEAAEPRELKLGTAEVLSRGKKTAILAYGALVSEALKAGEETGATVVDARFAKPLDGEMLAELIEKHKRVLVAEDGATVGGLGSACLEECAARGLDAGRLRFAAVPVEEEIGADSRGELMARFRLDAAGLAERLTEK